MAAALRPRSGSASLRRVPLMGNRPQDKLPLGGTPRATRRPETPASGCKTGRCRGQTRRLLSAGKRQGRPGPVRRRGPGGPLRRRGYPAARPPPAACLQAGRPSTAAARGRPNFLRARPAQTRPGPAGPSVLPARAGAPRGENRPPGYPRRGRRRSRPRDPPPCPALGPTPRGPHSRCRRHAEAAPRRSEAPTGRAGPPGMPVTGAPVPPGPHLRADPSPAAPPRPGPP
ncbi:proline-rich protein HaeIII subfamily 1-like [Haliaeetus albicilla]|uniref:proline-rich protein HaeIII subfamily 1-like n=1 Tax=Haliaeetus albicilla TaxID=8969 RepID=UPI0037E728C8